MKFINSLTNSLKDAIGVDKRLSWDSEELVWFERMSPKLASLSEQIERRFDPYVKKPGEPMISRFQFRQICTALLLEDFGVSKDELKTVDFDAAFNTHVKAQHDGFRNQVRALCLLRCLVSPFKEPSNFFYWFALCDTNKNGTLDVHEFRKLLQEKFRGTNQGKVCALTDRYFPEEDEDNVMINFWRKLSHKEGDDEVTVMAYIQAFPQDLLEDCLCSEIIKRCKRPQLSK